MRSLSSEFKQQNLPAWTPILDVGTVLPIFFIIGIIFMPLGVTLLLTTSSVYEHTVDYTFCTQFFTTNDSHGIKRCAFQLLQGISCDCRINFTLNDDFPRDVFMYYKLSNFYQNHRKYQSSRDDSQLKGQLSLTPSDRCKPFDYDKNGRPIAPCGSVANSMFSDELSIYSYEYDSELPLIRRGLTWIAEFRSVYRNPPGNLTEAFRGFSKPPRWKRHIYELDLENEDNNGFQNEDFMVWMRCSALPTFRKLYRRIDHSSTIQLTFGIPKGDYRLHVRYNYDVVSFGGEKAMVLSTTSVLGGKNDFLGIAYLSVGILCESLGLLFLYLHFRNMQKKVSCHLNPEQTVAISETFS